jgi:LPPG:FO 2-phospho-L-lactate transferase
VPSQPDLRAVVICPSNPFVSIEPILAVTGIRDAIRSCAAPVVAVTPIIQGESVKGPAAKMMRELCLQVSGQTVANRYAGLISAFVLDHRDPMPQEHPTIMWSQAQTLMENVSDREHLARAVLAIADKLNSDPAP